jgi:choline dehydrogenase-like flavoprotein
MTPTDVIVIGSGAGGGAAAYRLVLAGLRVLVLEKGAPLAHDGTTLDIQRVVTRGEFLSQEPWLDGRGNAICPEEHFNLGGKTKWYGAAVLRYSPREFEPEPAYAARGWPIGCTDLAPYYGEAERLLGVRTFDCEPSLRRILAALSAANPAWESVPLPMALSSGILSNPTEATHFDGFASDADLKGDADVSFLKLIADRPNFALRIDAEVVELLPAAATGARVGGVRLSNGEELRAPVILLAAGALHSPRLLSRYLAKSGVGAALPGLNQVGRNLKKHVLTALIAVSPSRKPDLLRKTMLTTHAAYPHSTVQPLGFDGELIATLVPRIVPRFLARIIGQRAYGFFLQTEDGSHSDNRVSERDAEIPAGTGASGARARARANATANGNAAATASTPARLRIMDYDATRTPASVGEHRAFTHAFQRDLLKIGMLSFTQATGLNGTAHAGGTLIAGKDSRDAVVDPDGAVYGIEGLYVVDGSILPRSSRVNPSLSIYAWALRVADLLAKRLQAA